MLHCRILDVRSYRLVIFAMALTLCALFAPAAPDAVPASAPAASQIALTPQERDWLRAHPVLNFSIDANYAPKNHRDASGEMVGTSVDYMKLLASRLGIQIRFEGSSWPDALAKAMKHQLDGVVNADLLEERKRQLNFTDVYAVYPQALATRKDKASISSLSELNGQRIAVIRNSSQQAILHSKYPDLQLVEVDDLDHGLALVIEGKAEGIYDDLAVLDDRVATRYLTILKFALVYYERPVGYCRLGLRNDDPMLLQVMNKAIASLTTEDRNRIQRKWISIEFPAQPGISSPALTPEEKGFLKAHRVIRVGADPTWAPVQFVGAGGRYEGIAWDYLRAIEPILGVRFEAVPAATFAASFDQLNEKKIDMLAAISITPQREKLLTFTRPYISIPIVVLTRNDVAWVRKLSDLKGKRVGVVNSSAVQGWLTQDHPEIQLVPIESIPQSLKQLERGELFAVVDNILTSSHYIAQGRLTSIKISGDTPYRNQLAMGVRNDWLELAPILQKALDALSEADKNAIQQRWIAVRYEHGFDYSLLWKSLAAAGVVVVGFFVWNRRRARVVAHRTQALGDEVAERRNAEEAMRQARDQAQAANRAKDHFLAAASHELRTPLTPALLVLSALEADPSLTESVRQDITLARQHIEIEKRLIGDLLDFSALRSGKLSLRRGRTDVHAAVQGAITVCQPDIDARSQTLELELTASRSIIEGDADRLRQVFWNLLQNSAKFTPAGGSLRVTSTNTANPPGIVVQVTDTGKGIEPDLLPRIFDPFEQGDPDTSQTRSGLGLGLAITQAIVQMHDGAISAVSPGPGPGATFTVTLPLPLTPLAAVVPPVTKATPPASSRRLLLVEDHVATLAALTRALSNDGHAVATATTVAEALALAGTTQFDLTICDIGLPDGSGLDLMRQLRARHQLTGIALSGFGTDDDRSASAAAGFKMHLTKPVAIGTLRDAIAHVSNDTSQ